MPKEHAFPAGAFAPPLLTSRTNPPSFAPRFTPADAALGRLERGDELDRDARPFLSGCAWTDPDLHVHTQ